MSAVLVAAGLVANPIALVVGVVFAGVAVLLWYQATGRLASRLYRRVERRAAAGSGRGGAADGRGGVADGRSGVADGRGGFGAGPREDWTAPNQRRGRRNRQRTQTTRGGTGQRSVRNGSGGGQLTAREAYDVLDLDAGADADAIRAAYRDRVKDVHPDAPDGDEAAFRRVRAAYERLSD